MIIKLLSEKFTHFVHVAKSKEDFMSHEIDYFVHLPVFKHCEILFPFSRSELCVMFNQPTATIDNLICSGKLNVSSQIFDRVGSDFGFFNFYELMKLEILLDSEEPYLSVLTENDELLFSCMDSFAHQQQLDDAADGLFNFSEFYNSVSDVFDDKIRNVSYTSVLELICRRIVASAYTVFIKVEQQINLSEYVQGGPETRFTEGPLRKVIHTDII